MSALTHPIPTLRDQFAMHAPHAPQPWFSPTVPPRPKEPCIPADFTADQRREVEGLGEWLNDHEVSAQVLEFCTARDKVRDAIRAHDRECELQRWVQWPYAWADAVLAQRDRVQT